MGISKRGGCFRGVFFPVGVRSSNEHVFAGRTNTDASLKKNDKSLDRNVATVSGNVIFRYDMVKGNNMENVLETTV